MSVMWHHLTRGTSLSWAAAATRPARSLYGLSAGFPRPGRSGGLQELPARTGKPDRQLHT